MRSQRWWDRTERRTQFRRRRLSSHRTKREQAEWQRTILATRHRNRASHSPMRVMKPGSLRQATLRVQWLPMRTLRRLVARRRYFPPPVCPPPSGTRATS